MPGQGLPLLPATAAIPSSCHPWVWSVIWPEKLRPACPWGICLPLVCTFVRSGEVEWKLGISDNCPDVAFQLWECGRSRCNKLFPFHLKRELSYMILIYLSKTHSGVGGMCVQGHLVHLGQHGEGLSCTQETKPGDRLFFFSPIVRLSLKLNRS